MPHTELNKIKLSYLHFNPLDYDTIETSEIYLAKPGHRIIGRLNGIDEDSCSLSIHLNNTATLEFSVRRVIDGEISNYYDLIERHYELLVTHFGWFKINEEPQIDNDGTIETKSIHAESNEIELQQYDKVNFEINTGSVSSAEMMATDNTYEVVGYELPRDNVRFYRDTTKLDELISEFPTDGSVSDLISYLSDYDEAIFSSWRVTFDLDDFDTALQAAIVDYQSHGIDTTTLEQYVGNVGNQVTAYQLAHGYPYIYNHITTLNVDTTPLHEEESELTIYELLQLERQREKELSFLDLVLEETGWTVGFVDPNYDPSSEDDWEREPLAKHAGKFEVDSQDVYSFLTQDTASYFRCIFDFDTENYKVNAYKVDTLGADTSIFLSFHNIQNSVTRSSDRELHTVYTVSNGTGEDSIDIREGNIGDNQIEDISYFLNTNHLPQSLIDKYNDWFTFREGKRQEYMDLCVQYRDANDAATEIYNRVPLDGANSAQYATMTVEQLEAERENYKAQLKGYEAYYVDENGDFDMDALMASPDYAKYLLITDVILSDPVDALVVTLDGEPFDGILDDDNIKEVDITYDKDNDRLGVIDTELYNRWQIAHYETSQGEDGLKKLEFDEDYMYDFAKYGDSYGVAELQTQLKSLYNKVYTYGQYANIDPDDPDEYHQNQKELYDKYKQAYDECATALEERKQEYQDALDLVQQILSQRNDITQAVDKSNFGFTDRELWLLQRYYLHTDYVNENIIITDISTNAQIVEQSYNLYKDAIEELYADSHPQWNFQTTQDNLLLMPELQGWHGQLEIGNFLRVGFREDDPVYIASGSNSNQVKLRLIGITLNPFMIAPTIDLEFSNMVQYKSKRNDFVQLVESGGGGSGKNQVSATYAKTAGVAETVNITPDFIMKIINSPFFGSATSSISASAEIAAIGAVSGQIGGLVTDAINHMDLSVDQIGDLTTRLSDLVNGYVDANVITSKVIISDVVTAEAINAQSATIQNISAQTVNATNVISALVSADSGDFDDLSANTAFIEYLNSGVIETGQITADSLVATMAQITSAQIGTLSADSAFMDYLNANLVVAEAAHISDLAADMANIDVLNSQAITSQSAFFTSLQSLSSSAATSVINDAYIYNAVANKITVGDLAAGDITLSNSMRIVSENGQMVMNGQALQIMGEDGNGDPYVGIQLGYDTNQNPSLILRNEDGATILTPDGITSNAIADGLIINDMISNGTIQKGKLGFSVIEPNQQGGIDITQIYDGNGGLWGEEYSSFKQTTQGAIDQLAQDIEDSANYDLFIETPNGTNIQGGNIQLNVKLLKNNVDVTDDYDASCFIWTRTSRDHDADTYWNSNHSTGAKVVTITANDVRMNADFQCKFEYGNNTVVAG